MPRNLICHVGFAPLFATDMAFMINSHACSTRGCHAMRDSQVIRWIYLMQRSGYWATTLVLYPGLPSSRSDVLHFPLIIEITVGPLNFWVVCRAL